MMYTRERLMKAVREIGRDGQPFTLGAVRSELGLKSRDKRELKRFRSRFRECSQILGDSLEKLGPNTYRLKLADAPSGSAAARDARAPTRRSARPASQAARPAMTANAAMPAAPASREPAKPVTADAAEAQGASRLIDRVGVSTRRSSPRRAEAFAPQGGMQAPGFAPDEAAVAPTTPTRRELTPEEHAHSSPAGPSGLGAKLSHWLGRVRGHDTKTASTALSRLAVDLQPKAANFEYRWHDGKLQVKLAGHASHTHGADK